MLNVGLDDRQSLDGPGHRDIERVDVELVDLERLVGLVPGAAVIELLAFEIARRHVAAHFGVGRAVRRDHLEQDDVRIFEALRFVDGEDKRRFELGARRRLVLVAQDDDRVADGRARRGVERLQDLVLALEQLRRAGNARGAPDEETALAVDRAETRLLYPQETSGETGDGLRVAEVGLQDGDFTRGGSVLCRLRRSPEQRANRSPGKEVRMHDLVRIAAKQEMILGFERIEDQRELGVGEILHFVDDDEIVARLGLRAPGVRDEVEIDEPFLFQPGPVFYEQFVHGRACLSHRVEGLSHPERLVFGLGQRPAGGRPEHAAEFLQQRMRVGLPQVAFQAAPPTLEPGAKGGEADLLALGDGDRIHELAKAHEFGVLTRIFVAVCAVEPARCLRQIGRERHIKNASSRLTHLGECYGRLARARRADDDERRRVAAHRLLGGVEYDRLIDEIKFHRLRRQPLELPAQARARLGLRRQIVRTGLDLVAIHRRAPQEAGLFVGVVGDHLQEQADGFAVVRNKLHQEARLVAELGAPIGRGGEFLKPCGGEVAAGERRAQSFERFGEAAGAEVAICDDSHSGSVRERRAETASFSRATQRRSPFDQKWMPNAI